MDIHIGHPDSLWLLWLVPVLAVFQLWVFRTKRRLLHRFASSEMAARLTAGVSRRRQVIKSLLVLLGLLACVLALAELQWGFTWEDVKRQGVDIVVALDVSDSMLVEDAEAGGDLSRLERAKREIADLLDLLEGDRIGLVAFAGTAFVECPLTLDYSAAGLFLDALDTELIPVKGTALGAAIRTSLEAFQGASHPSRAIILITDGEDHGGRALAAAEEAKAQGVRIFTIGIGRDEGSPIPAAGGGFRRDARGEIILSKLDETTLQKIALTTGGRYVRSVTGDVDLEQIYSQGIKATLEDQELGSRRRQRWEQRFQWILALALVALMLEPLIGERVRGGEGAGGEAVASPSKQVALAGAGRRQRRPYAQVAGSVGLICLLAAASAAAQPPPGATPPPPAAAPGPATPAAPDAASKSTAGKPKAYDDPWRAYEAGAWDQALQGFVDEQVERPEDPAAALNVGSAHYRLKEWEEAQRAFASAALAANPALREQALYNLGNTAYRQGRLEEAVELYKQALELDPDDRDAKFNLEFVRDEIRRRHEEAQKRQQEQQQQGSQDQNQQGQNQQNQDQQGQNQQDQQRPQENPDGGADRDQDGLPDATETAAENPTDPDNPDSDGDGLADGQEDANRNGRVDPGETDPNRADSDGDGTPDGAEAGAAGDSRAQAKAAESEPGELTREEAERYLQALQEILPGHQAPRQPGRAARPAKDW